MDIMEKGITSLGGVNRFFKIPLASLFNHLDGKTKSRKVGLYGVFTKEKKAIFVNLIIGM
jgi:hypothetical protein